MATKEDGHLSGSSPLRSTEVTLGEQIGKGSYGEVYKAKWRGRTVAAKRIHSIFFEHDYDQEIRNHYVQEFRKEWVVLSKLDHPHIVKMYTVLFPKGCSPIIITELLSCDLESFIKNSTTEPRVLGSDLIKISLGISKGLNYLHSQNPPVVHRDLATKNILLTEKGKAKIADLGVAKVFTNDNMSATIVPGTPLYCAPETYPSRQGMKYDDKAIYGVKADVFSFGVVLLAMIVGREPVVWPLSPISEGPNQITEHQRRKKDLGEVDEDHPLRSLILRCLETDPQLRPTAMETISELQEHEKGLQTHAENLVGRDNFVFERMFSLDRTTFDYEFKLLFIGDFCVGKSCLMKRYSNPAYDIRMSKGTFGVELDREIFRYGPNFIRAKIFDTAGQERFFSLTTMFFRDVHGIFLVCDVTREHTFESMHRWVESAERYCSEKVGMIVVGNKTDLVEKREVSYQRGKEFADTFQLPYIETSAKDFDSIQEMYRTLVCMLVNSVDAGQIKLEDTTKKDTVVLRAPAEPARSKCRPCKKS